MFIRWIRVRHTCTVLKLSHITKLGKIDFSEMSSNLTQEGSWSKKTLLAREYFIFISNLKRAVLVAKDGLKLILNSNFILFMATLDLYEMGKFLWEGREYGGERNGH